MTRPGGQCIFVALGTPQIPPGFMLQEKIVRGSLFGSSDVRRDFPALVRLFLDGHLYLEEMVSRRIPLHEANDSVDALREGDVARTLIVDDL